MLVDSPFTAFARTTLGAAFVSATALAALVALLAWASRPGHTDRRLAVVASVIGAAVAAALNVILGGLGVWQSTVYTLPAPVLASALGLGTVGLLLFLTGYRWLARRSRRALLIYGLSLFVVIAPLIVVGDTFALSQGYLAVGDG